MEYRNNHVLRKLRYALNLREKDIQNIFELDSLKIEEEKITHFMEKEDSPLFRELSDDVLERFLNGLITFKRGKKEDTKYESTRKKPKRILMPDSSKQNGFNWQYSSDHIKNVTNTYLEGILRMWTTLIFH